MGYPRYTLLGNRVYTLMGRFYVLKIEIDGHFHGSSDVPKPWVAQILGTCPKYGLNREFVNPMNDWSQAHQAWSGNLYGRVARFLLRDGNLYEVSRLRGRSSKRHVSREFWRIEGRKPVRVEPEEALARADGLGDCTLLRIPEDRSGASWVSKIRGLGDPDKMGFVVINGERLYRLPDGLYEVVRSGDRSLVGVKDHHREQLSEQEALKWLAQVESI
jgi:hypothetical protein